MLRYFFFLVKWFVEYCEIKKMCLLRMSFSIFKYNFFQFSACFYIYTYLHNPISVFIKLHIKKLQSRLENSGSCRQIDTMLPLRVNFLGCYYSGAYQKSRGFLLALRTAPIIMVPLKKCFCFIFMMTCDFIGIQRSILQPFDLYFFKFPIALNRLEAVASTIAL